MTNQALTETEAYAMLRDADEDAEWDADDVRDVFRAIFDREPDGDEDALSMAYAALPAEEPVTERCECGEWSGTPCEGTLGEDAATVEYMPEHLRTSHEAAGNGGRYPHNGAARVRVTPECATLMVDTDGEWCSVVAARPSKARK